MFSVTFSNVLILTLSALAAALPSQVKRDACTAPTYFTISGFTSFYPDAGNTANQTSTFKFSDSLTTNPIRCTVSGPHDPDAFVSCSDASTSFNFNGTQTSSGILSVKQVVDNCSLSLAGSVFISTYCYPTTVPFGPGTDCQIPSVSLTGEF